MNNITWVSNGKEITLNEIADSHLVNILFYILRKAVSGTTAYALMVEGVDFGTYDDQGEEYLQKQNYDTLLEEAKKRGILTLEQRVDLLEKRLALQHE